MIKLTARAIGAANLLVAGVVAVNGVVGGGAGLVASTTCGGARVAHTAVALRRTVAVRAAVTADGKDIADRHQPTASVLGFVRGGLSSGLRCGRQDGHGA